MHACPHAQVVDEWAEASSGVGAVFHLVTPLLKFYKMYTTQFEHAMATLDEWTKKSPAVAAALKECSVRLWGRAALFPPVFAIHTRPWLPSGRRVVLLGAGAP